MRQVPLWRNEPVTPPSLAVQKLWPLAPGQDWSGTMTEKPQSPRPWFRLSIGPARPTRAGDVHRMERHSAEGLY